MKTGSLEDDEQALCRLHIATTAIKYDCKSSGIEIALQPEYQSKFRIQTYENYDPKCSVELKAGIQSLF